jgi:hypothetical protein
MNIKPSGMGYLYGKLGYETGLSYDDPVGMILLIAGITCEWIPRLFLHNRIFTWVRYKKAFV